MTQKNETKFRILHMTKPRYIRLRIESDKQSDGELWKIECIKLSYDGKKPKRPFYLVRL